MKVFILLICTAIRLSATEQFDLASPLNQLLSDTSKSEDRVDRVNYLKLYRNFQKNQLLQQVLVQQLSAIRTDNSSAECFHAIDYLLNANLNGKSLQFLDAWGSFPSGILYGHLEDLGNFNECLSARAKVESLKQEIRGKYVLMKVTTVDNKTSYVSGLIEIALKIGTCFPSVCSDATIQNILQSSLEKLSGLIKNDTYQKLDIAIPYSKVETDHRSYSVASIIAISIFSILGAFMLLCTIYEYVMMWRKSPCSQLLIAFSVLTNGRKLFHINTNARGNNNIECLNGLRVFSMMWIIYGHTHSEYAIYPLINKIDILKYLQAPFSVLLQASPFAVDSFLLMSGLVITWVGLKKMEKSNGKLNIPRMYFHRYIRLTPVMAGAILLVVGIWPLTSKGPMLINWTLLGKTCEKNWWINLLYINNYFRKDEMCLPHSWYLAVDMQLFFLSPLILMGLWRWKSKFLWILLSVILLSAGCCLATMIINNFKSIILHGLYDPEHVMTIHMPTHIRIPSWIIGVLLGYLLHCSQNKKQRLNGGQLTIGWIIALSLMITVIFIPYHFSRDLAKATLVEAALFAAFGRIAWSLGLSWIIFACHSGYSRTLNSLLSYSGWQPIARLTYCMYIQSIMLQIVNAAYNRTDAYFSAYSIIQIFSSELIITMGCAVLIVLALESPIIAIERYMLQETR